MDLSKDNPPAADGRKVLIADVDHIWPAPPHAGWVWRCFLQGLQPILMDQYSYGEPKWTSTAGVFSSDLLMPRGTDSSDLADAGRTSCVMA